MGGGQGLHARRVQRADDDPVLDPGEDLGGARGGGGTGDGTGEHDQEAALRVVPDRRRQHLQGGGVAPDRTVHDDEGGPGPELLDEQARALQRTARVEGVPQQLGEHAVLDTVLPRDGGRPQRPAVVLGGETADERGEADPGSAGHDHQARAVLADPQQALLEVGELGVTGDQHGRGRGHLDTVDPDSSVSTRSPTGLVVGLVVGAGTSW